jgi:hypothetical protein
MTNRKREVPLRYTLGRDAEVKEVLISETDTPRAVVSRLKQDGFQIVDPAGNPFSQEDSLFGYATMRGALPVKILHGSAMRTTKARVKTPRQDNRAKVEIKFDHKRFEFARGLYPTYQKLLEECRKAEKLPYTWQIWAIRAEEDRIIVECVDGVIPFLFSEKACPPMKLSEDPIYQNAVRVPSGSWGGHPNPST